MSFGWKHYLELARQLTRSVQTPLNENGEARLRTAIGRAYYAAFGTAHDLVGQRCPRARRRISAKDQVGESVHEFVQRVLREELQLFQAASDLQALHGARIKADYYITYRNLSDREAENQIDAADSIVAELESLQSRQ